MKTIETLEKMHPGEIVNKRALALFKRLGLIKGYSQRFGYLEHGRTWAEAAEGDDNYCFTYRGMVFRSAYIPGCFNPYLVKYRNQPTYNIMYNIGSAKYVLNFYDGRNTHADGSKFYHIRLFNNKKEFLNQCELLDALGYKKEN